MSDAVLPCPKCDCEMVQRTNKRTGRPFYGCQQYPRCDGTLTNDAATAIAVGEHGDEGSAAYMLGGDW